MAERIVAYGSQTGYAQVGGAFIVVSKAEPRESQPQRIESSERVQRRAALGRTESIQKPEAPFFKPLARPEGERPLVPFLVAEPAISIINQIQDEKDVVVSGDDIAKIKALNEKYGDAEGARKLKEPEEVIVYAQEVLRNSRVEDPKAEDLHYKKNSRHAKGLIAVLKRQIAQAQGRNAETGVQDEEILTKAKVQEHLTLEDEDFGSVAKDKGPGAMAGGTGGEDEVETEVRSAQPVPEIPITQIIAKMRLLVRQGRNTDDDSEWAEYRVLLDEAFKSFERAHAERRYLAVLDFANAIDEATETAEHWEPPTASGMKATDVLDSFIPSDKRREVREKVAQLDSHFNKLYSMMDPGLRARIFSDLELEVGTEVQAIIQGWHNIGYARMQILGGKFLDEDGNVVEKQGAVARGRHKEVGLGDGEHDLAGIREWRATTELYAAERRVSIDILTRPPSLWQEVPERISHIYRFIERSEFTIEQLQSDIQKALAMIETVSTDDPEGREVLNQMNKELKAFQAFHSFWVTLRHESMNPESVIRIFNTYFDDETWVTFSRRFGVDARRRMFKAKDIGGGENNINLLDENVSLYFGRIQKERKVMNEVENLTMRELNLSTDSGYEKWLIMKIARGDDFHGFYENDAGLDRDFESFRKNITSDQKSRISLWGRDIDKTKEVVDEWYRVNTLLGAHGEIVVGRNEDGTNKFVDLVAYRHAQVRDQLADLLKKKGLKIDGDTRNTEQIISQLEADGFLDAVGSNARNLAWTFAWSDFDIVRIYGLNPMNVRDKGLIRKYVPRAIAFNQDTNMFYGRHTDHFLDFVVDEERGRSYEADEVNATLRKYMLGKHGNILPQNRFMVRVARFFMSEEQKEEVKRRVGQMMLRYDFVPDESYRRLLSTEEAADPDDSKRDPYFKGYEGWARSAVIAEMIDSGEIDLTHGQFSRVSSGIRKFEMVDIYNDRKAALDYFGRGKLQGYLRDPSDERFLSINDKDSEFYSGRNVRLWPWLNIAFRAHYEIAHKKWKKLFDKENKTSAAGETIVEQLVQNGVLKKEQGNYLKRELLGIGPGILGTVPIRRARQWAEFFAHGLWEEAKSPGFYLGSLWELLKRILAYLSSSFGK